MSPEHDSVSGPFVSIACICQTPLQEGNGILSIIRVVDRIPIVGTTPQMQPQPLQNLVLVVVLRSGGLQETHTIKIRPLGPSGTELPATEASVLFEGQDRGPAIILPVSLVATEEGLYWFDVYLEQQLLTRIPLRVIYQRLQPFPFQPPQPPTS
jgi:Family of unknown function (DUF6941)